MAKDKKDRLNLTPILFLLLAAFFVFLFLLPDDKAKSGKEVVQSKEFADKVNKHLFRTTQKMELTRERAAVEAAELASKGIDSNPGIDPMETAHPLDVSTDDRADALVKALGREVQSPGSAKAPSELIQAELFEAQQLNAYTESYKKEYARQFVENAKKAGYLVKLNDQYKVISVQRLKKPEVQYDLFESGSGTIR